MSRSPMKWIVYVLMLLLVLASVSAVGVTPARKYFEHKEGGSDSFSFNVLKDPNREARFAIYAEGDFAEYIEIEETLIVMAMKESQKSVKYTVNYPSDFKPGVHEASIRVIELPQDAQDVVVLEDGRVITTSKTEQAQVGAVTSVLHQVQIQVPYPGVYVEGKLFVSNNEVNKPVDFRIPVYNFGTDTVEEIYARIEIMGANNEVVKEITTERKALAPKTELDLNAQWGGAEFPGKFHAKVTVIYGDKRFVLEKNFHIGNMFVRVNDVLVEQFQLGGVAKFDVFVENTWNQVLPQVYGDLSVLDQSGKVVSDFKTVSQDLIPNQENVLEAFWDTSGVVEGMYDLKVTLHYAGKQTEKVVKTLVSLDGIEFDVSGTGFVLEGADTGMTRDQILVSLVLLLIALNVIVIYMFVVRKRPPQGPGQHAPTNFNERLAAGYYDKPKGGGTL